MSRCPELARRPGRGPSRRWQVAASADHFARCRSSANPLYLRFPHFDATNRLFVDEVSCDGSAMCSGAARRPSWNRVTTRGKKKYLGGVGTKVTGIARRQFKPNLQRVKISTPHGNISTYWCARSASAAARHRRSCGRHHSKCRTSRRRRSRSKGRAGHHERRPRMARPRWPGYFVMSISRQDVEKVALSGAAATDRCRTRDDDRRAWPRSSATSISSPKSTPKASSRWPTRSRWPTCFATDVVTPSLPRDEALANAPHHDERGYLVPAVLGE